MRETDAPRSRAFQSTLPRRERRSNHGHLHHSNKYFNPHSHEGSDRFHHGAILRSHHFNPHSHEGSDADFKVTCKALLDFNPHSHEGSDLSQNTYAWSAIISIHTPTKGATAILTNNFLIFCSISLINFALYLKIIQILFIFRYKFIFYFIF